jgi:hypothetical protein
MTHKHRRYVLETDVNPADEAPTFKPDGNWLLQGRFWLAGVISILIAGASVAIWINNTFVTKDEFYRTFSKHEGQAVARAEDLQRHESLPSHPAMYAMMADLRVQLEGLRVQSAELKNELAYLRQSLLGDEVPKQNQKKQ